MGKSFFSIITQSSKKQNMIRKFFLNLLFPKFCFGCQKEGSYLCQDCLTILEISSVHQKYSTKYLKDLYFALPYQKALIKNLIQKFKYEPFIKELAETLSLIIITHFQLLDKKPNFSDFILIPIPLNEKRLRWRGFNQAEEISKELSKSLKLPLVSDCLFRIKNTFPQIELDGKERKENVKNVFYCQKIKKIFGKKILLVDDVYTTGATMEEAARVLKEAGAKEIIGLVVARAKPGQDKLENF
jgi:ComF family protein